LSERVSSKLEQFNAAKKESAAADKKVEKLQEELENARLVANDLHDKVNSLKSQLTSSDSKKEAEKTPGKEEENDYQV